ncbi:MAG: amidase family protein [Pseudomonadota bacterium]
MTVSLRALAEQLGSGHLSAVELARQTLERADASQSVFTRINDSLISQAEQKDKSRDQGNAAIFDGIPLTIKDLFDIRGEITLAGSRALEHEVSPAAEDASVVATLRSAGFLFAGRTNMSEFAFSGMGMNPHFGTPLSIWDRQTGRLPGGSSSGSAVSVAEGIVAATMGSDTAGSCRVPAAFNGIVGVKPSYGRYSLQGVYPLSPSSDAPGPLAVDVDSCFLIDRFLTGRMGDSEPLPRLPDVSLAQIRLAIPKASVMQGLDSEVETAFSNAVELLRAAGVEIIETEMSVISDAMEMFLKRPVVLYEAWNAHRERLERHGDLYDPYVRLRMSPGEHVSLEEQQERLREKSQIRRRFESTMHAQSLDAVIYPTAPVIPPPIPHDVPVEQLGSINLPCLRNTATVNYLDGCSISLPCHANDGPPVGLMVSAVHGADDRLYEIAAAIERVLRR